MGFSNYPPGARTDPNAPYNERPLEDYLPVVCEECDFRAETVAQLQDHEHSEDSFRQPDDDPYGTRCVVYNPPDDVYDDHSMPFCDEHERDDLVAQLKVIDEELTPDNPRYRWEEIE